MPTWIQNILFTYYFLHLFFPSLCYCIYCVKILKLILSWGITIVYVTMKLSTMKVKTQLNLLARL